jgi:hypothetical protein
MATLIRLENGDIEVVHSERDFARLIEIHMGWESRSYFEELMYELDNYREEDPDYDE